MAEKPKRRAYERFKRPDSSAPHHVDVELTPPPREMPAVARSRTPTPDEISTSFAAVEAQLSTLRDGLVQLWPARHVADEIAAMRSEFRGYTQSMASAEATARGAWDAVKDLMPRLDRILQAHGAVEQLADSVTAIDTKLDAFAERFAAIEKAQGEAAVRFEDHDKRDQVIEQRVGRIEASVSVLEDQKAALEAGDKRELALTRRKRRLTAGLISFLSATGGAIAGWFTK